MSEENPNTPVMPYTEGGEVHDKSEAVLNNFLSAASVEAVYGNPVQQENYTIIPAAEVLSVVGFGFGTGGGSGPGEQERQNMGGGSGGGGGGRVLSRPVAVVVISADGVKIKPVVDVTKIALGALTAFGFMLTMRRRMRRGRIREA